MPDPPLAPLAHRPHPPFRGRAYAVFLRAGGLFNRDWLALVHRDGWAVPESCPPGLLRQAREAGETGHPFEATIRRVDTAVPPAPPQIALLDEPTSRLTGPLSACPFDEAAVRSIVRVDELVRRCRHLPDPWFRRLAVSYLLDLGLWSIPDLRAYDAPNDHLDPPGSWCVTVLLWLDVLSREEPATERSARVYWTLTSLQPHPPGTHHMRLTHPIRETDPT